jgi:hypothetical protein
VGTYSAGYELVAAWLGTATGIKLINVPYKGLSQTVTTSSATRCRSPPSTSAAWCRSSRTGACALLAQDG